MTGQGVRSFGTGCGGSKVPTIRFTGSHAVTARAGIAMHNGPARARAILFVGLSNKNSPLGSLPFDLSRIPGFGPGCRLHTSYEVVIPMMTDDSGASELRFKIPKVTSPPLYLQFASGNSTVVMSDALEVVLAPPGVTLLGRVTSNTTPVPGARVTLFAPNLSLFLETRTDTSGNFKLDGVPLGTWRLGIAARDHGYVESAIVVKQSMSLPAVDLSPEKHPGRFKVIGNTLPHFLDATDMAVLLPDGRIWYCHDTVDPLLFDPVTGKKEAPVMDTKEQGCFNSLLLADGNILVTGGQDGSNPANFRNAVRWTKRFNVAKKTYTQLADLLNPNGRWYPGLARLADGSPLVLGGGQRPNASRTATVERYDLVSGKWQWAASMKQASEFSPSALLYTGEVLKTWSPPELYDPKNNKWRATSNFVQPSRQWPGHSDHSLVVLEDGRALAVGIAPQTSGKPVMGEIYDPKTGKWSLTANAGLPRLQTEVIQLPDGRILVAGGEAAVSPIPVSNKFGIVKWSELYDVARNRWRRVADMLYFREYHAVTLLVPDGRVITTGGTVIKFRNKPVTADIEAFEPPYLFRGVRPTITGISATSCVRGQRVSLSIHPATSVTSVVLVGFGAHTHWLDSGVKRRLVLPVQQIGTRASVTLPKDPNVLPLGHYMLFAMVDDIPSVARVVQVR
ncbi:MAG: galactose oxidase-like domain-containing protein [Planctomycetota bacterium]